MKTLREAPPSIEFPSFFENLKATDALPEKVLIGSEEQTEVEKWVWDNVFKKEAVGETGTWLYDHMQRTSDVLENAGINTHDFEHVKTVMVNACSIFLMSQGTYLGQQYDLSTETGRAKLFEKLSITAVAALFHDIGYLECLDDYDDFAKSDLDDHPVKGANIIFDYGHSRIGRMLKQGKKKPKALRLVYQLLDSIFQPAVAERIKTMGQDKFYKKLRKVRAAISSHDSPDNQDGTDEAAKLDNLSGEAIAVYLADKTHIGQRMATDLHPCSKETITDPSINVAHDRLTYLIKSEGFELEYGRNELVFKLKLEVDIPEAYQSAGYDTQSFIQDFETGYRKRYRHAQKVFRRLMHREHLNNASARMIIEANINGVPTDIMELPKSEGQAKTRAFVKGMR